MLELVKAGKTVDERIYISKSDQGQMFERFCDTVIEWMDGMSIYHNDAKKFKHDFLPVVACQHIDGYVGRQYGSDIEAGTDPLSSCEPHIALSSCLISIQKYKQRFGKNQRPYNDGRDCCKRAHYACLAAHFRGRIEMEDVRAAIEAFNDWESLGGQRYDGIL